MQPSARSPNRPAGRSCGWCAIGERTAGDIAARFPISRPAVSQHLRALEDADLVVVRPDGTRRWYRARPEGFTELRTWLETMWRDGLVDLKRAAEAEERTRRAKGRARPSSRRRA